MKEIIIEIIKNYIHDNNGKNLFDAPLIGFADARNYAFKEIRNQIETHCLPEEFMTDAKTVIAYFIPFSQAVIESNISGKYSSKLWVGAGIESKVLISNLNTHIKNEINKLGFDATVVPAAYNFNEEKLVTDWSQRHIAVICKLGQFGKNNMLITEKGCCGKIGSIVTNIDLDIPSSKIESEYCLYKMNKSCGLCITKCISNSLGISKFDRNRCYDMCKKNAAFHKELNDSGVCGKCIVGLPCSTKKPYGLKNDI